MLDLIVVNDFTIGQESNMEATYRLDIILSGTDSCYQYFS